MFGPTYAWVIVGGGRGGGERGVSAQRHHRQRAQRHARHQPWRQQHPVPRRLPWPDLAGLLADAGTPTGPAAPARRREASAADAADVAHITLRAGKAFK